MFDETDRHRGNLQSRLRPEELPLSHLPFGAVVCTHGWLAVVDSAAVDVSLGAIAVVLVSVSNQSLEATKKHQRSYPAT